MRRALAGFLNERGTVAKPSTAKVLYRLATFVDSSWSTPWYNLGLRAKYEGNWTESFRCNHRSTDLKSDDQAAWWNLGIAATALRNWPEARRAWKACGIALPDGEGEIVMKLSSVCVRLDPQGEGEVVWTHRLDPARARVLNVPLPACGHRYGDIILTDGASNGTRMDGNREVPVFDELELWRRSGHSTFQTHVNVPRSAAFDSLRQLCEAQDVGMEDWSTVRNLCKCCSESRAGPYEKRDPEDNFGGMHLAFGALNERVLTTILNDWTLQEDDADFEEPELVVDAFK